MKVFDYKETEDGWLVWWEDSYWWTEDEEHAEKVAADLNDIFTRGYDDGFCDGYHSSRTRCYE